MTERALHATERLAAYAVRHALSRAGQEHAQTIGLDVATLVQEGVLTAGNAREVMVLVERHERSRWTSWAWRRARRDLVEPVREALER